MVTNYGIFTPIHYTTTFESYPSQQISIFSFSPEAVITFHGLKYPVNKRNFKELWEGSLNEATANQFTIELTKNAAILVFAAFHSD
jgi:thiamine pyrophosphokinase